MEFQSRLQLQLKIACCQRMAIRHLQPADIREVTAFLSS
jgi:hypothetical protein